MKIISSFIIACYAFLLFAVAFQVSAFSIKPQQKQQKRVSTPNPAQKARLYVSYCPTDFTNAIAVVEVAATTGAWKILGTSHMPSGVFGCSADYNPTFASDPENPDKIWMDFTSDTGYFVSVETVTDASTNTTKVETAAFESRSLFFTGFLNFKVRDSQLKFEGMTGTVTQDGFCSDGCIGYGIQDLNGTRREKSNPLPFRAIADDTSFLDKANNVFYVQASHDLRDTPCAPQSFQDCLLSIDSNTGELLKSVYNHDEHIYRFGFPAQPTSSSMMISNATTPIVDAFIIGANARCNRSADETSYAFARVNLAESKFQLLSCVTTKIVIHEAPWISSFSPANDVFVTSSGDGDGDDPQFVTFDVATGNAIVETKLSGLASQLKAKMGLIFVWAVSMPPV